MSDAKVTFTDLNDEPCAPGGEERFGFNCPKHQGRTCEGLLIRREPITHPTWVWDGNRESPTFSPSIDCKGCWHGYIRAGRCVDTAGADEPEP